jgi:hypothetical protein
VNIGASACSTAAGTAPPTFSASFSGGCDSRLGLARICSALSILKAPFTTTRSPAASPEATT